MATLCTAARDPVDVLPAKQPSGPKAKYRHKVRHRPRTIYLTETAHAQLEGELARTKLSLSDYIEALIRHDPIPGRGKKAEFDPTASLVKLEPCYRYSVRITFDNGSELELTPTGVPVSRRPSERDLVLEMLQYRLVSRPSGS